MQLSRCTGDKPPVVLGARTHRPRLARRVRPARCSDAPSTFSSAATDQAGRQQLVEFRKGLPTPVKLLPTGDKSALGGYLPTVYTLRITTGYGRGSGLSRLDAAVLVCLVGKDGAAIMRRIPPINDPLQNCQEALELCKVAGREMGANRDAMAAALRAAGMGDTAVKPRFQEGAVDEISFLGPDLGPLAAALVAPEEGTWRCAEVAAVSARTGNRARFVCRERGLGAAGSAPAAFLAPLPEHLVVYGSGDTARFITKEEAASAWAAGMRGYGALKRRVTTTTALLVVAGASVAWSCGGWAAAGPFAAGGAGGLAYQLMLQAGVDAVALRGGQNRVALTQLLGHPAVRLAVVGCLALGAASLASPAGAPDPDNLHHALEVRQVLTGLLGFMMYKIAIVSCSVQDETAHTPAQRSV